jgi:hypothetical protein
MMFTIDDYRELFNLKRYQCISSESHVAYTTRDGEDVEVIFHAALIEPYGNDPFIERDANNLNLYHLLNNDSGSPICSFEVFLTGEDAVME